MAESEDMVYPGILSGKLINLRSVELGDSEFILSLRKNEKLARFMPAFNTSLTQQIGWIESQRKKEGDYYFLISDKNNRPLGTISTYNINTSVGSAESGRVISTGNGLQNLEAILLNIQFAFYTLGLQYLNAEVFAENERILSLNKQLGYTIVDEYPDPQGFAYVRLEMTRQDFERRPSSSNGNMQGPN